MSNGYADHPGVVAPPPLIYGLPLAAGWYMNRRDAFPVLPAEYAEYAWWIGVALIAVGVVLGIAAFGQFLRKHTAIVPYRPTTAIIRSGPFRITRNPVYLAMTLGYIGSALMLNTMWPLLLLPLVLLVVHRGVILREERYLEQKFGDEYNSYKVSVRRWI